jgi:UDP-N-acetylmuramoyl-tripeptide--D-alanyl-D-alanine ligase
MFLSEQILNIFLVNKSVSTDSRKIKEGDLYFALRGPNFNGNQFVALALNAGAVACIMDDEAIYNDLKNEKLILVPNSLTALQHLATQYRNLFEIPFIAITGSNGKTTTKELVASVLSKKYNVHFTKGNYNNNIGVPLTLLSMTRETQIAVIEMGANHKNEIEELCTIAMPDCGIISNIGKAHLEGFGGIEGVKIGKSEMYRHLAKHNKFAFVNESDAVLMSLIPKDLKVIHYNSKSFELIEDKFVKFRYRGKVYTTQLVGDYNMDNIATALKVGQHFGVEEELCLKAIEEYVPSNNRSQLSVIKGLQVILDAYNANPTSVMNSIKSFINSDYHNKVIVLGDMLELGQESEKEHLAVLDFLQEDKNIKEIILIGPIYSSIADRYGYKAFKSTEEAKKNILLENYKSCTFLLKGSRGIGVEKLFA